MVPLDGVPASPGVLEALPEYVGLASKALCVLYES